MKIQQKYNRPNIAKLERIKEEKESNASLNTLHNTRNTYISSPKNNDSRFNTSYKAKSNRKEMFSYIKAKRVELPCSQLDEEDAI